MSKELSSATVVLGGAAADAAVGFVGAPRTVDVDIVVPVYNEQAELGSSIITIVHRMRELASDELACSWQVVIADNASCDNTWWIAKSIVQAYPQEVRAVRMERKGRGYALKQVWGGSRAQTVAYMDVDLSTDLSHLAQLLRPLLEGSADVVFGSRLLPASHVKRCLKREVISRTYNRMLQGYLGVSFRDAQCGFKAMSSEAASMLVPQIVDDEWFFDTELLVLAERAGLAMREIPVTWIEDAGSTVHIVDTVWKDLMGMHRLKRGMRGGGGCPRVGSDGQLPRPARGGAPVQARPMRSGEAGV